ncbi:MAG: hypothetical protein DCF25_12185 [Leptolyngbya foveolarum]|uniref:Uncharacterized protein n=1 Tax=Leptolyngbya foveolarum TaxID=47253 RepID=A0A2W4VWD6_9CYAN|nr:MAG: hypothetical protein DCF25_12185 [Leptolyngbya foveolarum]
MSLGALYSGILAYRLPIVLLLFGSPWVTYLACHLIPGKGEEPSLLSLNLALSTLSVLMWVGYLAFATNTGGWAKVVNQADFMLLVLPIYHVGVSLWLSQLRLPLQRIPAFRTMQGLVMLEAAFFALSWVLSKIRIVLFSYLPFGTFLGLMALLVVLGYVGYRKIVE